MAGIEIRVADAPPLNYPLAASTVLGRHASCLWLIEDYEVPLRWVELRWFERPAGPVGRSTPPLWGWRILGLDRDTRGPRPRDTKHLPDGWSPIQLDESITRGSTTVRLVDGRPPEHLAVDLWSRDLLSASALADLVTPSGRDDLVAGQRDWIAACGRDAVTDGDVFVRDGRPIRVHLGVAAEWTYREGIRVDGETCSIRVLVRPDRAVLEVKELGEARTVTPGAVYMYAVYALARKAASRDEDGGWLRPETVLARLALLGRNADREVEGLNRDATDLRAALEGVGVQGCEGLFETRRTPSAARRIGAAPARVSVQVVGYPQEVEGALRRGGVG